MITVNTQLHGYRQGHQLLESTISLSKSDQSAIDRLSDVAGPLRPGELFEPYLSAYPLPSERFYVLARTWQDLTVPRAGCVKTLSVIIPTEDWQNARGLQPFLGLLDPLVFPSSATSTSLIDSQTAQLPHTPEFPANELLEALFLEEAKPVALIDAPSPELIAVRLLTALWPNMRRRFALSTFALSPRKIEGRNFDLVFVPNDARSRFAGWPGRRIDARATTAPRHRWTGGLVERVFQSPTPWLLADNDIRLIGEEESGTPAALRIALLWHELLAKLEQSPSAALGLLDIANSKMHSRSTALLDLQPALSIAAQRAAENMAPAEAWEFLGAMVRKIFGTAFAPALASVTNAVGFLAGRSPDGAVALIDRAEEQNAINALVPTIADSLAANLGNSAAKALNECRLSTFRQLILASQQLARASLAKPVLIERMAEMAPGLGPHLFELFRDAVMPGIVEDKHAILARPLFGSLSVADVLAKVEHLKLGNYLKAKNLLLLLIEQGRRMSVIEDLRGRLLSITPSADRDELLRMTLLPVVEDAWWLLRQAGLNKKSTNLLLEELVWKADTQQFQKLFTHTSLAPLLLERIADKRDLLYRAVTECKLPLKLRVPIVLRLLTVGANKQERELAGDLMNDCLRSHFGGDELASLLTLFTFLEPALDGGWVVRTGLGRSVSASVISRNIVAFNMSPNPTRQRILEAIEDLGGCLAKRIPLDLNEVAATACAALLWDSQSINLTGLLRGAGQLLPTLLHSGDAPVSAIVAATFPLIYRELAREDDVPDLFKFIPFLDWDRCKAARRELVDAFISSEIWRPGDLALTACRASDVEKIIQRVAKSQGGEIYLSRITEDLNGLPDPCREKVKQTIKHIQSD